MPFSQSPQSVAKYPGMPEQLTAPSDHKETSTSSSPRVVDGAEPSRFAPSSSALRMVDGSSAPMNSSDPNNPRRAPESPSNSSMLLQQLYQREMGRCAVDSGCTTSRKQKSTRVVVPWTTPSASLASSVAWNPSRMRNMVLVVGPGTPASVCWPQQQSSHEDDDDDDQDSDTQEEQWPSSSSNSSDDEAVLPDGEDTELEEEDDLDHYHALHNEDERMESDRPQGATEESKRGDEHDEVNHDANNNNNNNNNSSSEEESTEEMETEAAERNDSGRSIRNRSLFQFLRRRIREVEESSDGEAEILLPSQPRHRRISRPPATQSERAAAWLPSLRHGGCINTACWLDCPWRVSKPSQSSSPFVMESSTESPTQILTSGDDRLIKIFDVSNAMGTASLLPGGWDTYVPFLHGSDPNKIGSTALHRSWRQRYSRDSAHVPGAVQLLATLSSGHRGNVFHVTPVDQQPGRVLSCGADGYLRVSDLQSETSAVVLSPFVSGSNGSENDDDDDDIFGFSRGGMAYSHQMLTANTGLLCSERGLHHFDLRLAPREQGHQSLLPRQNNKGRSYARAVSCKACAVWKSGSEEATPTMVFAGGSAECVELLDLRMNGSSKKILQRYRPQCLDESVGVSVSGLDVSKDKRELLVSYESDQIYSFPIFPDSLKSGPTMEDITAASTRFSENSDAYIPELASYGGHLNRFTFLKNAKYAGPKDDYIITGSDSGNAWIYERKTGTVVSLLSADSSTCNGIIAHPTLPFFVTYGIDSTAKLWRAAPCVEPSLSDSSARRAQASLQQPYEMSPVTKSWDAVQTLVRKIEDKPCSMPDFVASSEEVANSGRFSSQTFRGICGPDSPRIGNSIRNVPMLLRMNRYECYRGDQNYTHSIPVEQPLEHFTHRVSLHRLRLQADRLGVRWNPLVPWAFEGSNQHHPADLVPDNPSDWILLDRQMTPAPLDVQMNFNLKDYESILQTTFPDHAAFFDRPDGDLMNTIPWLTKEAQSVNVDNDSMSGMEDESDDDRRSRLFQLKSQKLLYETATLLKEGGNQAVKKGLLHVAARRYDKAIQYCGVAFLHYPEGSTNLRHLTVGHHADLAHFDSALQGGRLPNTVVVWSPLLQILITARLNLSLLLAKLEFAQPSRAADQARAALKLLLPFTRKEGKVYCGYPRNERKKDVVINNHEPSETFRQAKELQAKAYFRLGSAEMDMGDYSAAIGSLEQALKSSNKASPNKKADSLLLRRLQEAKRKRKAKKKRDRQKFQRLLNSEEDEDDGKGKATADDPIERSS